MERDNGLDIVNAYIDKSPSMFIEYETTRSIDEAEQVLSLFVRSPKDNISNIQEFRSSSLVVSDFQGIGKNDIIETVSDSSIQKTFIVTGNINEYKNVFIDSLNVDFNPDDLTQMQIVLYVKKSTRMDEGNLVFRLHHGERQLSSVVKKAEELDKIVFDIPVELYGQFEVEIEGDGVYYDNNFRFIISKRIKPTILLISDKNNSYLDQVFANSELFVIQKIKSNSIDFDQLQASDVIIIEGISTLPSGVTSEFKSKTIVTFPPAESIDEFDLEWMNISTKTLKDSATSQLYLSPKNPIFSGIFTSSKELNSLPFASSVFSIQGNYETIISLRNGNPLLIRSLNGLHYFFNVPLDIGYTNLPTHSIFLPILYKIALGAINYDARAYYFPGDLGYINAAFNEIPPKILGSNLEIIPEFNPKENGISFLIPDLEPGYYQLLHNRDTFELAVNIPKEESYMEGIRLSEMVENFGHLKHVNIQSASTMSISGMEYKNVLWKYALILIVFILLTETLFHRYLK